ncbi:unnamed protein product [Rangifer tarandus platyrhynchus]|uniref:Uncharacterized protein n=1 Tax=Rangifer tarandus platyrhynchus TaxID=3082113 RepID=A0AC59YBC3_RANTA
MRAAHLSQSPPVVSALRGICWTLWENLDTRVDGTDPPETWYKVEAGEWGEATEEVETSAPEGGWERRRVATPGEAQFR